MTISQLTRVDTLIITVGTRQIGWHCHDGIVRCLGADGDRGTPPHIDELYHKELKIERGYHQDDKPEFRWGVRDLAQRLYSYCQQSGDFSRVELLLDHKIIADSLACGLKQIILWGTHQPETVPWKFRRGDTLFCAHLMAGKIQQTWSELKGSIEVKIPLVGVKDTEQIRRELETTILPAALQLPTRSTVDLEQGVGCRVRGVGKVLEEDSNLSKHNCLKRQGLHPTGFGARFSSPTPYTPHPTPAPKGLGQFVLAIENTGCAPDIANGLEICAAALVRQCQVLNIKPIEPNILYLEVETGLRTAQTAQEYKFISVGDYFWPLERERVISAWERGDFHEAELWLTSHQRRYDGLLYQLAGRLALSTNWDIYNFLHDTEQGIESWLQSEALKNFAEAEQIDAWKEQLKTTQISDVAQAWESQFLIYLQLIRCNYTTAFMQFAQTLERLLSIYAQHEDWVTKGIAKSRNNDQELSFYSLINAWCKVNQLEEDSQTAEVLHRIREQRNHVVYKGKPLSLEQVKAIWFNNGLYSESLTGDNTVDIMQRMNQTLQLVCHPNWEIPEKTLLRSLYDWGLILLQSESNQP